MATTGSAKEISDEELRRRLLKMNMKVGPITATTRQLYHRKLMAAEAALQSPIRRATTGGLGGGLSGGGHRFSSDESDEDDSSSRPPVPSVPTAPVSLVSKRHSTPRGAYFDDEDDDRVPPLSRSFTGFNSRLSTQFDDRERDNGTGGTWPASSSLCRPSINGVGQYKYQDKYQARASTNSFGSLTRNNDDGLEYSTGNTYRNDYKRHSDEQNSLFRGLRDDDDPLLGSSVGPVQRKIGSNQFTSVRDQLPSTGSAAFDRPIVAAQSKSARSHAAGKWQLVPMLLVALVAVFFLLLGYVYWHVTSLPVDPRNNYLLCAGDDDNASYRDCIPPKSLSWVLELAKHLVNFISSRAGDFDCGYEESRNVTTQEFNFMVERHTGPYLLKGKSNMKQLLLKLFIENPHWGVRLYDDENLSTSDIAGVRYLMSDKSQMSVWCRFQLSAAKVFSVLLSVLFAVAGLLVGLAGFKKWKKYQEEETKEVLKLVESIIDKVKQQADAYHLHPDVLPYLAIAHVRDSLIPLLERQKKQRVWDKAVEFINSHESRIRTEDQKIESEDFTVWRWVSPSTDVTKVWQGQAFGEHGSRVHNYPPTLTTCLKIRNMFDVDMEYGEDWHVSVEDAILEKCGSDHGILHVAADRASKDGCVYVRCRDLESAGRAFKALHGWWFDGKLVTVKYLREQRYYERFPEASRTTEPAKMSNTSHSSLSQPFHSSIIETS